MGQIVFVPSSAGNSDSTFVSNMLESPTDYVGYGFPTSGGEAFFSQDPFSFVLAFRFVQEEGSAGIPLFNCESNGNYYSISTNVSSIVFGEISGAKITPATADIPLGRVIVACLTYDGTDQVSFYLQGRLIGTDTQAIGAPDANVSFLIGGGGSWLVDSVEYLGFAFMGREFSPGEVADVYVKTQDSGKVSIPANLLIEENYSIYNASSGLADITLWVPEANTMSAPDVPQVVTGACESELKRAPMHMAHSGWATPTAP